MRSKGGLVTRAGPASCDGEHRQLKTGSCAPRKNKPSKSVTHTLRDEDQKLVA